MKLSANKLYSLRCFSEERDKDEDFYQTIGFTEHEGKVLACGMSNQQIIFTEMDELECKPDKNLYITKETHKKLKTARYVEISDEGQLTVYDQKKDIIFIQPENAWADWKYPDINIFLSYAKNPKGAKSLGLYPEMFEPIKKAFGKRTTFKLTSFAHNGPMIIEPNVPGNYLLLLMPINLGPEEENSEEFYTEEVV